MTDLFDLFDPMPYLKFFESLKVSKGRTEPRPTAGLKVVTEPYVKFATKRSRSWPNSDLIMLDAAIADQLGAFLRHPVAEEVERAGISPDDFIYIQRSGGSVEYQLVRKAG